jgi:aspartyl aminopeptidase
MSATQRFAEKACSFLSASTDPFHVVKNAVAKLEAAGFTALPSNLSNAVKPGGKYYYAVHSSTLVAFTVGTKYAVGEGGFHIIGGHTDSPNLAVKPKSKKPSKSGCVQLAVSCYGGGLWHTWFDRDLGISGKVLVRSADDQKIESKLVQLRDPVARVSTLCIHLQSAEERKAFAVNKEDHTSPILGIASPQLEEGAAGQINDVWQKGQEPLLMQRIAKELDVGVEQIVDFELSLYDTQPAAIGGMNKEFMYSARLDNLATVFCAVEALASNDPSEQEDISLVVAFDHEEVGSTSLNGAGSPVLDQAIRRISAALGASQDPEMYAQTIARSFCLSIDQAHAVHPNYAHKHDAQHAPTLNSGFVIKTNGNQRYTTNSLTGFLLRELARKCNVPVQEFAGTFGCFCFAFVS